MRRGESLHINIICLNKALFWDNLRSVLGSGTNSKLTGLVDNKDFEKSQLKGHMSGCRSWRCSMGMSQNIELLLSCNVVLSIRFLAIFFKWCTCYSCLREYQTLLEDPWNTVSSLVIMLKAKQLWLTPSRGCSCATWIIACRGAAIIPGWPPNKGGIWFWKYSNVSY